MCIVREPDMLEERADSAGDLEYLRKKSLFCTNKGRSTQLPKAGEGSHPSFMTSDSLPRDRRLFIACITQTGGALFPLSSMPVAKNKQEVSREADSWVQNKN